MTVQSPTNFSRSLWPAPGLDRGSNGVLGASCPSTGPAAAISRQADATIVAGKLIERLHREQRGGTTRWHYLGSAPATPGFRDAPAPPDRTGSRALFDHLPLLHDEGD